VPARSARPPEPAERWRWLPYLDGPLAGRVAVWGWHPDAKVPARLVAYAGARFHFEQEGTVPRKVVDHPGEPVAYVLTAGGYRLDGEQEPATGPRSGGTPRTATP